MGSLYRSSLSIQEQKTMDERFLLGHVTQQCQFTKIRYKWINECIFTQNLFCNLVIFIKFNMIYHCLLFWAAYDLIHPSQKDDRSPHPSSHSSYFSWTMDHKKIPRSIFWNVLLPQDHWKFHIEKVSKHGEQPM